jgi:uncharacterized membrane protein
MNAMPTTEAKAASPDHEPLATSLELGEDPITAWTRRCAVASLLGLIILGLAWELFLAPTGQKTLALKVLPLTLPLAGFLKRRMYTYRWVSLFVWIYFTEGVVRAASDVGISRVLAGIEIALCLALFAACLVHVRWRLSRARAAAQGRTDTSAKGLAPSPTEPASTQESP